MRGADEVERAFVFTDIEGSTRAWQADEEAMRRRLVAHDRLAKGDKFVAEGYVREYDHTTPDGEVVKAEEFVAKKLGHDLARTRYEVKRTRRQPAVTREAAGQSVDAEARREARNAAPALGL